MSKQESTQSWCGFFLLLDDIPEEFLTLYLKFSLIVNLNLFLYFYVYRLKC